MKFACNEKSGDDQNVSKTPESAVLHPSQVTKFVNPIFERVRVRHPMSEILNNQQVMFGGFNCLIMLGVIESADATIQSFVNLCQNRV